MFTLSNAGVSGRQAKSLGISLAFHGLLLGWLLHNPVPTFLASSSVAAGEHGSVLTQLYWPNHPLEGSANTGAPSIVFSHQQSIARERLDWKRLEWNKSHKLSKPRTPAASPTDEAEVQASTSSQSNPAPPAGLPYGTSPGGLASGDEIRPALPVSASDPVVDGDDLAGRGEGSVVVEITIDDKGNIVQKVVLQSLGPVLDSKVLAALESWHFSPATRNGVAIPSKQDVYYHFKPTG